jgi:hypothetical protein
VGEHSILTTDRIAASSIGDTCKVHGELSNTILVGHSNKGHDGFVGHSILGRWVNLGAGTITSNLKNTYGTCTCGRPPACATRACSFSARCSATTQRPASAPAHDGLRARRRRERLRNDDATEGRVAVRLGRGRQVRDVSRGQVSPSGRAHDGAPARSPRGGDAGAAHAAHEQRWSAES